MTWHGTGGKDQIAGVFNMFKDHREGLVQEIKVVEFVDQLVLTDFLFIDGRSGMHLVAGGWRDLPLFLPADFRGGLCGLRFFRSPIHFQ